MTATAVSVKTGSPKPPEFESNDCDELQKRNEEQREDLKKKLGDKEKAGTIRADEQVALQKARGGGTTFSSAKINVGIGAGKQLSGVATACSSGKAFEQSPGGVVQGGSYAQQSGDESVLCDKADFKHAPPAGDTPGAHGEAKLLNEITNLAKKAGGQLAGGSMLVNVDWRYDLKSGTYQSKMPCRHCFRALCAATRCGIEIWFCDADKEPKKMPANCDSDKPDASGETPYSRLNESLDKTKAQGVRYSQGARQLSSAVL